MKNKCRIFAIVVACATVQQAAAYQYITADCGRIDFNGGNMTFNYGNNLTSAQKNDISAAYSRVTAFSDSMITMNDNGDSSFSTSNGQNEVYYNSSVGTANCWYSFNTSTCDVVEADMQYGDEPWVTGEDSQHWPFDWSASGGRSILGTAVHEGGHCVGMAHENSLYNMMGSDWTHVTRQGTNTYYGPGEDLSAGLILLHGERSGGSDTYRDVGATVFRFDAPDGAYSDHKFGVLRDASSGTQLPVTGSFQGQDVFEVVAGETVTMELTFENNGEQGTETPNIGFFLSTNSIISNSDTLLKTDTGYTLGRNTPYEVTENVTIPLGTTPGNYFLGAFIDYDNQITETTGANNIAYYPVTILAAPPDLVVPFAGVDDSTLRPGEGFSVLAITRNQGDGPSDATTLRYYRSTNSIISTGDALIGTDSIGALSAGGQVGSNDPETAPSAEGTWWVGACVDSVSRETSTSNNCSSGAEIVVAVEAPDVATDPANLVGADQATLNATVNPNGGQTTVYFDWGLAGQLNNTVTDGSIGSGLSPVSAAFPLQNLDCDTTYDYRVRASNSAGSVSGGIVSFTTQPCDVFNDRFENAAP